VFDFYWDSERSILSPNVINILEGGTEQVHLSRSKIFTNPLNEECVLVCAGEEATRGANIWDSRTSYLQQVATYQPVLDIDLIENHYSSSPLLSCLSENAIKLYKVAI